MHFKLFKIRLQINMLQYSGIIVRDVTQRMFHQNSPWAKTPKIGVSVPIGGTSAIMEIFNLHLLKFKKIHDVNDESVAFFGEMT